jgi:two-component system sensor kinase FixL
MITKKKPNSKQKILKKSGTGLNVARQKRTKKQLSQNKIQNKERSRLIKLAADLTIDCDDLGVKVRQQSDKLRVKNRQLRNGARKQLRAEDRIAEQREELLHVTRVGKLAEFVSSLAHEISQPLAAILSYAQAAKRILAGRDPQIQEILQYIIDDDHRADEVIQRLRSLLKKSVPEIKPLDINAVISETIVLIATDANLRGISLKFDPGNDLPLVNGDRIQLQQVLLNLISNSFDALDGSQGTREIWISTSRKSMKMIVVEVKDSGCGIPAQNMPKLFTHFFTSKADGLGMGLSISRSIVEDHGGHLDAKNNPDGGAIFYFTLLMGGKDVA